MCVLSGLQTVLGGGGRYNNNATLSGRQAPLPEQSMLGNVLIACTHAH